MNDKDTIIALQNEVLRLNGVIRVMNIEKNQLQQEINSIYGDAVKYPQLAMPERQLERIRELVY